MKSRKAGTTNPGSADYFNYMTKDQRYKKKGITPEKIIAFIESRSGKSQLKVAKELGVSQATICGWTGEIMDFIKQSDAYKQVAPKLVEMIPRALLVYDRRLEEPGVNASGNPDLVAAKDVLKMAGVFIDRVESKDTTNKTNDSELKDRLAGLLATEFGEDESGSEGGSDSDSPGAGQAEDGGTEPILPADNAASE